MRNGYLTDRKSNRTHLEVGDKCNIKFDDNTAGYWWGDNGFNAVIEDIVSYGGQGEIVIVATTHGYGRYAVKPSQIEVKPVVPQPYDSVYFPKPEDYKKVARLCAAVEDPNVTVTYIGSGQWDFYKK